MALNCVQLCSARTCKLVATHGIWDPKYSGPRGTGDLNIAPAPLDHCDPGPAADFARRADRAWLAGLLRGPFRDVFRVFHPDRRAIQHRQGRDRTLCKNVLTRYNVTVPCVLHDN